MRTLSLTRLPRRVRSATDRAIDGAPGLATSPYRLQGELARRLRRLQVFTVAYFVFAVGVWPSGDSLNANLGQVVVMLYGAALIMFSLVATALVVVFRKSGAPLAKAYVTAIGIVGVVMLAFLGQP